MKYIYFIILLIVFTNVGYSQSLLEEGNKAYSEENYVVAANKYQSAIEKDGVSSEIYYNLGNAYYRMNEWGKSILNYERALVLNPNNKDAYANLILAQSKIVDPIETDRDTVLTSLFYDLMNCMSSNGWAITAVVCFVLLLFSIALYLFMANVTVRKVGFFGSIVLLVFVVVSNICSYKLKERIINRDEAIIQVPSVTLKSAPRESSTAIVPLHEGSKVKVLDKVQVNNSDSIKENWIEVKVNEKCQGWLPESNLEII